jgi:hypothetical protein
MSTATPATRYKNHRFPPEIISHAVWLYFRFCLSFRDVEEGFVAIFPLMGILLGSPSKIAAQVDSVAVLSMPWTVTTTPRRSSLLSK